MAEPRPTRGKLVDLSQTLSEGRKRAGVGRPEDDPPVAAAPAEQPLAGDVAEGSPGPPPETTAPPAQRASLPPVAPTVTARAEALYVRVPAHLKDRVDEASHALRRMKASNQEIIAALIDQEVDPSTPAGLAALTRRLDRYRRGATRS
jgi:hypothetical protein